MDLKMDSDRHLPCRGIRTLNHGFDPCWAAPAVSECTTRPCTGHPLSAVPQSPTQLLNCRLGEIGVGAGPWAGLGRLGLLEQWRRRELPWSRRSAGAGVRGRAGLGLGTATVYGTTSDIQGAHPGVHHDTLLLCLGLPGPAHSNQSRSNQSGAVRFASSNGAHQGRTAE